MKTRLLCLLSAVSVFFASAAWCGAAAGATSTWKGGCRENPSGWDAPENWSGGKAPAPNVNILIPGGCPAYPQIEKNTAVNGNLFIEKGGSLNLNGHDLIVSGNLVLKGGTVSVGNATLTIGRSLLSGPIPADGPSGRVQMGKNGTICFNSPRAAVLEPADGAEFKNFIVDKGSGSLRLKKPLIVNGFLKVRSGRLEPTGSGEIWMGVARHNGRIADIALRITDTITPEKNPEVLPAPVPKEDPPVEIEHPAIGPTLPISAKLTNIAPSASIRSVPYTAMVRAIVDPDPKLRTMVQSEAGTPAKGTRYEFRFGQPQSIARIRWSVVSGPWAILADTDNSGKCTRLLRFDTEGKLTNPGGVWRSRSWVTNNFWPPVKAYAVQVVSPSGRLSLYDFQILSPDPDIKLLADSVPAKAVPELAAGNVLHVPMPPPEKQFLKGFHIEPWMFGLNNWLKMPDRPPLAEYKGFRDLVQGIRKYNANYVNMWPPRNIEVRRGKGTYESDLLWPSRHDKYGLPENILKEAAEAFRANGIQFFTMDRCVYPREPQEFPPEAGPPPGLSYIEAPYVSRATRNYLKGVVLEEVRSGVDGVGVGFDEQYWTAIRNPKAADKATREAFEERHNVPLPKQAADTEAFRKWVLFAYEEFASYIAEAARAAKASNPRARTFSQLTILDTAWNTRLDWGVANDVVGHAAPLDYFGTIVYKDNANIGHFLTAAYVKRAAAANPEGGVYTIHNCPWAGDPLKYPGYYRECTPVYMNGPPISAVMNGAASVSYWRYNFIFYGGYDQYVRQAFSVLDTLATWGAKDARIPEVIAVLRSRASEDWWQVKQRNAADGDPMDQTRGFVYEKWLHEFLLSRGYPFRMISLDHPQDLKDLDRFKVVILPFPYSMSRAAYQMIEKAMAKGTKLIVFDQQAETDEIGNRHSEPLLKKLIESAQAVFLEDDIPSVGHYPQTQAKVRSILDRLLGADKPLYFDPHGNDVEPSLLVKNDREKFIGLINWTDREVKVDAGVQVPPGTYAVFQRNPAEARSTRIAGKQKIDAADLDRFRVTLSPWEVKVLYIHPE